MSCRHRREGSGRYLDIPGNPKKSLVLFEAGKALKVGPCPSFPAPTSTLLHP